ncbi:ribose-binding protein [Quadrisphaera granulorum]|uniref:Ribose-binding protein n=1 Tax=Quadrisphaera granulorum TaxID=317664 RepID=A0A316A915_9ACTN|nr:substrate-binding domain-containing protein [Quadrisphaera granulorum]PWJ54181.1 ribose-binding protein [Quadrisphaera granulorum]SZE96320.1 ribose-binding protein [Quadrisphaera granulorum]
MSEHRPAPTAPRSGLTAQPSRRSLLLAGGLLTTSGLLAACGSSSTASAGASSGSVAGSGGGTGVIGISLNGNNAYSSYVAEGVYKVLDGTGFTATGVQNNFSSATELSNVQNLLAQGIKGLVVLPADATTIAKAAQLCVQQQVPVGNALWPGSGEGADDFAGKATLDSVEGGKMIGEWLKANAKPGPVVVVQGIVGQGFSEKIDEGLDAALAGSGFSVVVREQGFFARDKATQIVQTALQAHPDVTAIVAYSASMSNGIAAFLKGQGTTTITHVSSDADDEMITWLKTPYLAATRYYSAAQTGVVAAQAVLAKIQGTTSSMPDTIDQVMATKDTIDDVVAKNPYRYEQYAALAAKI